MAVTRRKIAVSTAAVVAAAALGTGLALPANAGTPEGTVVGADAANAVKGSYLVTLKESAAKAASAEGRSVVAEHGGTVKETFTHALNGYAASMSAQEARELAADPAVDKVYADKKHSVDADQADPPNWGLDRVDQPALPLDSSYTYPDAAGEGATAYIIDTGVRISHQDFGGRAANGYDAIDEDEEAQDGNGHGTHVASTVAGDAHGVAKKAKVVAVRVLDDAGSGTTAQVVAGIDWVTQNASGPSVANMSLGGPQDEALDEAVRNSIAAGITYAVAAGNDGADADTQSPARVQEAITVGATDDTDAMAEFSNYGSVLDVFAPERSNVPVRQHQPYESSGGSTSVRNSPSPTKVRRGARGGRGLVALTISFVSTLATASTSRRSRSHTGSPSAAGEEVGGGIQVRSSGQERRPRSAGRAGRSRPPVPRPPPWGRDRHGSRTAPAPTTAAARRRCRRCTRRSARPSVRRPPRVASRRPASTRPPSHWSAPTPRAVVEATYQPPCRAIIRTVWSTSGSPRPTTRPRR